MKKKILITIGGIIVSASILLNLYLFVWQAIEQRIYMRGVNDVIGSIVQQVKQKGEVNIQLEDEVLRLVPYREND